MKENKWLWKKEINSDGTFLRLTYSADDNQIVCITLGSVLLIDSYAGEIIKKSDLIAETIENRPKYPRFELSNKGKYFAYWDAKYLTYSRDDESGFLLLGDFLWHGIKWLFCFGAIPHYVYIWDIYYNQLYDKVLIPYESNRGTPAFTIDEDELFLGPYDGLYNIYSLEQKKIIKEFHQKESVYKSGEERTNIDAPDFKIISANKMYVAACLWYKNILIISAKNGSLIKKFKQASTGGTRYAMAFSSDSKYFVLVTKGNLIQMYETNTWKKLWGKDII